MTEQVLSGAAFGVTPLLSTAHSDASLTAGIIIFAVGIVVGLTCVLVMDFMVRRRMEADYHAWVAAGRPERRVGERRGAAYRVRR